MSALPIASRAPAVIDTGCSIGSDLGAGDGGGAALRRVRRLASARWPPRAHFAFIASRVQKASIHGGEGAPLRPGRWRRRPQLRHGAGHRAGLQHPVAPGFAEMLETNKVARFSCHSRCSAISWRCAISSFRRISFSGCTWPSHSVVLTAALMRFHCGRGAAWVYEPPPGSRSDASPVAAARRRALLFFPRIYGGFRFQFGQSLLNSSGMSEPAFAGQRFRAGPERGGRFSRGISRTARRRPMAAMYWRGVVLWHGDDLHWVAGPVPRAGAPDRPARRARHPAAHQPPAARRALAVRAGSARPATVRGAEYTAGRCVCKATGPSPAASSTRSCPARRIAKSDSRGDQRVGGASKSPRTSPPRVQGSGRKLESRRPDTGNCRGGDELFSGRAFRLHPRARHLSRRTAPWRSFSSAGGKGFCEHYAAAFATLMRIAGIPSRVVLGYHGGEFNQLGKYVIVHQSDAHAWCEVWIRGQRLACAWTPRT